MPVTKLTGKEVYANMCKLADLKEENSKYFHFDSLLWKAIWEHIGGSRDCVLVDREGTGNVVSHRGTGWAVRLLDAHRYPHNYRTDPKTHSTVAEPPTYFCMKISVESYCEDEDRNFERTYYLSVPIHLLTDFTKAKFENWIAELREIRYKEKFKRDQATLRALMATYPKEVKEILHETRNSLKKTS